MIDDHIFGNQSNDVSAEVDNATVLKSREFSEVERSINIQLPEGRDLSKETMESSILETTTFRIVVSSDIDMISQNDTETGTTEEVVSRREITTGNKKSSIISTNSFDTSDKDLGIRGSSINVRRNEIDDYNNKGFLSVRKNGKWGKLCLAGMDNLLERKKTIWTVEDLGRAVCKAITYQ